MRIENEKFEPAKYRISLCTVITVPHTMHTVTSIVLPNLYCKGQRPAALRSAIAVIPYDHRAIECGLRIPYQFFSFGKVAPRGHTSLILHKYDCEPYTTVSAKDFIEIFISGSNFTMKKIRPDLHLPENREPGTTQRISTSSPASSSRRPGPTARPVLAAPSPASSLSIRPEPRTPDRVTRDAVTPDPRTPVSKDGKNASD